MGQAVEQKHITHTVTLRIPVDSSYLSILRTTTAGLAALLHFRVEAIEDLRVAVDEACTLLLAASPPPGADIVCRFTLLDAAISVDVHVFTQQPPELDTVYGSFGWQVLTALTDAAEASVSETAFRVSLQKNGPSA